jgi:hypothetical protein
MTISDLGSIGSLLAAIAVFVTLIYLSRQVRQGNLFAKSQARQRMVEQAQWEWFQYKDGIIDEGVYRAYHDVIGLHLGIPRTRRWWKTVGRIGFNPVFVAEVDALLAGRELAIGYYEDIRTFDSGE